MAKKKPEAKVLVKGQFIPVSKVAEMYGKPLAKTSLRLLEKLSEKDEPMLMGALAKELNVTRSYLYGIVKALEKKGYIAKLGRRNMLIALTEAGVKQVKGKK